LIAEAYEAREYGKAVREIMRLADLVNQYADANKPWELAKQPDESERLQQVCSELLNAFRVLTIYLRPVLPATAQRVEAFMNLKGRLDWANLAQYPRSPINEYQHLMSRIDPKQIAALLEANRQSLQPSAALSHSPQRHAQHQEKAVSQPVSPTPPQPPPGGEAGPARQPSYISIDEFSRIDLRVARIVEAQHVEGADKLLRLQLDVGGETRQVFAGIKSAYDPEQLKGRLTVVVANLQPRKMRFGESQGMVLAASGEGPGIFLLSPDEGAQPGMKVK
jgi:methionyl-tRNA synthetase